MELYRDSLLNLTLLHSRCLAWITLESKLPFWRDVGVEAPRRRFRIVWSDILRSPGITGIETRLRTTISYLSQILTNVQIGWLDGFPYRNPKSSRVLKTKLCICHKNALFTDELWCIGGKKIFVRTQNNPISTKLLSRYKWKNA